MAALMVPQVLSFVQVEFPAKEHPQAFAIYGMTFALGGVGGPLIGGLLTQADLFGLVWRPIFLIVPRQESETVPDGGRLALFGVEGTSR